MIILRLKDYSMVLELREYKFKLKTTATKGVAVAQNIGQTALNVSSSVNTWFQRLRHGTGSPLALRALAQLRWVTSLLPKTKIAKARAAIAKRQELTRLGIDKAANAATYVLNSTPGTVVKDAAGLLVSKPIATTGAASPYVMALTGNPAGALFPGGTMGVVGETAARDFIPGYAKTFDYLGNQVKNGRVGRAILTTTDAFLSMGAR